MRRILVVISMLIFLPGIGQNVLTGSPVPHFNLLLTDGARFTYRELPAGKPLLLLYFSPDCDHCRKFIGRLRSRMKDLRDAQVVMVSYFPVKALLAFRKEFRLDQFPNIRIGTEGNSFFLPAYFKIGTFPFIAVFNSAGKLATIFREEPSLEKLIGAVKK